MIASAVRGVQVGIFPRDKAVKLGPKFKVQVLLLGKEIQVRRGMHYWSLDSYGTPDAA